MGNGVVTSGVLESSGRVPALAVEGGLGCLGNGRGFADQLAQLAEVVGGERNLGRGIAISAGVRVAVVDADAVIAQARLQSMSMVTGSTVNALVRRAVNEMADRAPDDPEFIRQAEETRRRMEDASLSLRERVLA